MKGRRVSVLITAVLNICLGLTAQGYNISYSGSGGYELVERTNLRRYENGKYIGLTNREVRSYISPSYAEDPKYESDQWYDGSFYVWEETRSNNTSTARGVNKAVPSVFHISKDGKLTMHLDNGYPSFRSFPSFTTQKLSIDTQWKASAVRSVDPLNKGVFTRIPVEVLYTFKGEEVYHDQPVYRINAIWQTNYGPSHYDYDGDKELVKAGGGHKAEILVLKATGESILISDNVDETFLYKDGKQINFKGTITLFTKFPPAVQHDKLIPALNRIASVKKTPAAVDGDRTVAKASAPQKSDGAKGAGRKTDDRVSAPAGQKKSDAVAQLVQTEEPLKNGMVVEQTSAGLRLSVRDIRFKSDSDEILPTEAGRLDEIASVLKLASEGKFLVEGHTASVGKPQGEQVLSEQRAMRIAEELSKRGIKAECFICRGWGGTKPVAPNETEANRAQNRRVEITILE